LYTSNSISLRKIGKTSNASYKITKLFNVLPLQTKFKKLLFRKKWMCGRTNTGRISVYTKGKRSKKTLPYMNYKFRITSLFFVGGINYTHFWNKISTLVFTSTGQVSYVPTRSSDNFFFLNRLQRLNNFRPQFYRDITYIKPYIKIRETSYMLLQQKKNSHISFLELIPLIGSQYARSLGSRARIIKLDTRTGLSLVKLPSGIKKVFSAFSLAHEGPANLPILKKQFKNTKSGF
jgi:ribosomal protein L2